MRETFHSVKSRSEELGVEPQKILGWIHSGELRAINIAERATGRPRWRIPASAWNDFLTARTNRSTTPPPAPKRRRRRPDASVIEFY